MESSSKQVAYGGVFLALALAASYLETCIPLFIAVPGVKIGLANAVIMPVFYQKGMKKAATLSLLRIVLAAVLFQGLFSMIYSIAGAVLSLLFMQLVKKKMGMLGVSVIGAVMHNIGQILVTMVVLENGKMLFYLPILLISGVVSGSIVGILTGCIVSRYHHYG